MVYPRLETCPWICVCFCHKGTKRAISFLGMVRVFIKIFLLTDIAADLIFIQSSWHFMFVFKKAFWYLSLQTHDVTDETVLFRSDYAAVNSKSRTAIWAMLTCLAVTLRPITRVFCIQILSNLEKTQSDPIRVVKSFLNDSDPFSVFNWLLF